jgi:hypothetical protein
MTREQLHILLRQPNPLVKGTFAYYALRPDRVALTDSAPNRETIEDFFHERGLPYIFLSSSQTIEEQDAEITAFLNDWHNIRAAGPNTTLAAHLQQRNIPDRIQGDYDMYYLVSQRTPESLEMLRRTRSYFDATVWNRVLKVSTTVFDAPEPIKAYQYAHRTEYHAGDNAAWLAWLTDGNDGADLLSMNGDYRLFFATEEEITWVHVFVNGEWQTAELW